MNLSKPIDQRKAIATRNGRPAWQDAKPRLRQSDIDAARKAQMEQRT